MKRMKLKLILLQVISFIVSILPLAVTLFTRRGIYIETPRDLVCYTAAGVIGIVFVILKVLGKLRMPRRIVTFAVVFVMSYLMRTFINDIVLLSGMALLGEFLDLVFCQRYIKKLDEQIHIEKTSDATADKVEKIVAKYINGRT